MSLLKGSVALYGKLPILNATQGCVRFFRYSVRNNQNNNIKKQNFEENLLKSMIDSAPFDENE